MIFRKVFDSINELTSAEKTELVLYTTLLFVSVISILLAITWSRGNDIDYFKMKVQSLEDRFNVAEKSRSDIKDKLVELEVKSFEHKAKIENLQVRSAEMENWLEEYNKLPQLPKPRSARKMTALPGS